MGSTFSRLKVWASTEVVSNTDLNAEFDNILNNLNPSGINGEQASLAAMRATLAPSESALTTSLQQEIQEVRYMLQQLAGGNSTYWYSTPTTSLTDLKNAIGGALTNNRIVSGFASSNSSAPRFLQPAGSSNSVTLKGAGTSFTYVVNGTSYTQSTDLALSGMSLAVSTQNTATASGAAGSQATAYAGAELTKTLGEDGTVIGISGAGTAITAVAGQLAAFKIVHSATTEYFVGYVNAAGTQISNCFRGFFVDSTRTPIDRVAISDADVITLMKLTWLYMSTTGTLTPVYTNPTFSATAPSSPNTGDYWYDLVNGYWKTYGGVSWATANAILVGVCIQDSTNCVAARALNFYSSPDSFSNMNLQWASNTQMQQLNQDARISVNGNNVSYSYTRPIWDITANLESGQIRTVSTTYYLYVGEQGQLYISSKKPYDLRGSLKGWYHPAENWRAVARVQTNATGSGNFDAQTIFQYDNSPGFTVLTNVTFNGQLSPREIRNLGLKASVATNALTITLTQADGVSTPTVYSPVVVGFRSTVLTTFSYIPRMITGSVSITVPNTCTLGHTASMNQYVWVYLVDNGGAVDIAVSGVQLFDENSTQSTTTIATSQSSGTTLYSNATYSSKSIRLIGRLLVNQATAGTWVNAPTEVDVLPVPQVNISEPTTYTPSFGGVGTASAITAYWIRCGRYLRVYGGCTTGTVTAALVSISLPNTLSIDPNYIQYNGNNTGGIGAKVGWFGQNAGAGGAMWSLTANTGTSATVVYAGGVNFNSTQFTPQNGTVATNSNAQSNFEFEVPVVGWSVYGP